MRGGNGFADARSFGLRSAANALGGHSDSSVNADAAAASQGQGDSAASSDAKGTSAQGEDAAAEESTTGPALDPSEVSGYWILNGGKGVDDGILAAYWFDENGTFVMKANVLGVTLDREGTYRIEGDKVYVSVPDGGEGHVDVPSGGSGTAAGIDIKINAIEDGEVTIDGDVLSTRATSTKGELVTANRISEEQYQEYFDQVSALGPKNIAVGEAVETPTVSFTVDSFSLVDEIYPSDTSGYYSYLSDEEGKTYLLAEVTFTNEGTEYCSPGYATEVMFNVGENTYSGSVEVDGGARFSQRYSVDPKETSVLYIHCSVPDAALDSGDIKMTWTVPSEQQYMNTYWKASFPHDTFIVTM